jgi:hypothetical protein
LIWKGKSPAKQHLKARILLKADVGKGGEGWSDSKIIKAFNSSVSMVYGVRQQHAKQSLEAVFSRKQRAAPAIPRIFDDETDAKLMTLAYLEALTLSLLAGKAVASKIVDAGSPSTVGRV